MRAPLAAAGFLALAACSKTTPDVTLELSPGAETDAFSKSPPVARVDVTVKSADGSVNASASAAPGGSFDLGDMSTDASVTVDVHGFAGDGSLVLRGRSVPDIPLSIVSGALPVFVERTGSFARPGGLFGSTHTNGVAASFAGRFVALTGGSAFNASGATDAATAEYYDLYALGALGAIAPFPRKARSIVSFQSQLLLIDDAGATAIDFDANTTTTIEPPSGLAFKDVAGGAPIIAADGRILLIGATRTAGDPTDAVLVVATDGTLSSLTLTAPRLGAAACANATAVIVVGGSASAPGVEVLGSTGQFGALDYPPDATGSAAMNCASSPILLVGAKARTIDPACTKSCKPTDAPDRDPPVGLANARGFLAGERFLVVGETNEAKPSTRAFFYDASGAPIEAPLREPRGGATTAIAPNGSLFVLGGAHPDGVPALSVEALFLE